MYCLWWTCPPVSLRQFLLLLSSSSSSPASSSSTFSFLPIIRLVTPVTLVIQVAPNLNNISGSRFNHVDLSRTNGPCCCRFSSSVRSSYSHPDLLLTHHPTPLFQITPVLNTGLSLSEPLQLYKGYNAI